jgi:hypothetical protein
MPNNDVSPQFKLNFRDSKFIKNLISLKETPKAIGYFDKNKHKASDYAYWFGLSTLWVSYTGYSDIKVWRKLFSSSRKNKLQSIMKPSELFEYQNLPQEVIAYRAKRVGETEWLAYTLNTKVAGRMAKARGVNMIYQYSINKRDITALFLRREEFEVIVTDQSKPKLLQVLQTFAQ